MFDVNISLPAIVCLTSSVAPKNMLRNLASGWNVLSRSLS